MNNFNKKHFPRPKLPAHDKRAHMRRKLDVYHPGYLGMKPLLTFNSSDYFGTTFGVDHGIVYAACTTITGNHWHPDLGKNTHVKRKDRQDNDFYLSETPRGEPCLIPDHGILPFGRYWWVHPTNDRYPFCPNIDQYVMPSTLPLPWVKMMRPNEAGEPFSDHDDIPRPSPAEIILEEGEQPLPLGFSGESCRITGAITGLYLGHIIPKVCSTWYNNHHMRNYATSDSEPLNGMENRIAIRGDLHCLLNHSHMVMVPKEDREGNGKLNGSYTMRIHVLNPPGYSAYGDLTTLAEYHNIKCYPLLRAPPEYLLARFAWSLMHGKMALLMKDERTEKVTFNLLLAKLGPDGKYEQVEEEVMGGVFRPREGLESTENQGKGEKRQRGEDSKEDSSASSSDSDTDHYEGPEGYYRLLDNVIYGQTRKEPKTYNPQKNDSDSEEADSANDSDSDTETDHYEGPEGYQRFMEDAIARLTREEPEPSTSDSNSEESDVKMDVGSST